MPASAKKKTAKAKADKPSAESVKKAPAKPAPKPAVKPPLKPLGKPLVKPPVKVSGKAPPNQKTQPGTAPQAFDLPKALLDAFATSNRINRFVIESLNDDVWQGKP